MFFWDYNQSSEKNVKSRFWRSNKLIKIRILKLKQVFLKCSLVILIFVFHSGPRPLSGGVVMTYTGADHQGAIEVFLLPNLVDSRKWWRGVAVNPPTVLGWIPERTPKRVVIKLQVMWFKNECFRKCDVHKVVSREPSHRPDEVSYGRGLEPQNVDVRLETSEQIQFWRQKEFWRKLILIWVSEVFGCSWGRFLCSNFDHQDDPESPLTDSLTLFLRFLTLFAAFWLSQNFRHFFQNSNKFTELH